MKISDLSEIFDDLPEHLRDRGVESLYPPQESALDAGITSGENIVASVPTASGKTLIAELAMLADIARGGKALYIVPLRALANEKGEAFERLTEFGISVGVSTGNYQSDSEWLGNKDIIVATSEKVDSLIRNNADWIDNISCVVADEIHLVNESDRGPTLEITLGKLQQLDPTLQIVALSATIGNADEIADWLDATLIDSTWRPIELKKGVQFGNAINFADGSQRDLDPQSDERPTETLVRDALSEGGSTLLFVNSRRNAESAAKRLSNTVTTFLTDAEKETLNELATEIRDITDTETSETLANTIEHGVAFHHAGLSRESRTRIEEAFQQRYIKAVCATPTLAAGVNTPSRRVIVRDWRRYDSSYGGMKPLDTLEVHQMFGRAGRPGKDPYGEAVLLASSHDQLEELFERYIYADPEPVRSKLAVEPALRTHVLATVATGFARSMDELWDVLNNTLYAVQSQDDQHLEHVLQSVIEYLKRHDFLEETDDLVPTRTGRLVSQLYIDPMSAATILNGIEDRSAISALGLFHLISRTPDMYELYLRSGDEQTYAEIAYERADELPGSAPSEFEENAWEDWLAALKTGKLLEDWVNEVSEEKITNRYSIGPGDLRGKVETAEWLLNATERLAGELTLSTVTDIRTIKKRVEHGVEEELTDLVEIRNVGRKRARWLYEAGFKSRKDLRDGDPNAVLKALHGRRKTTQTILENVGHPEPTVSEEDSDVYSPSQRKESQQSQDQSNLGDFE